MITTASLDQMVHTEGSHPFPFQGRVVAMTLVVVDASGTPREVDARWVNDGPRSEEDRHAVE